MRLSRRPADGGRLRDQDPNGRSAGSVRGRQHRRDGGKGVRFEAVVDPGGAPSRDERSQVTPLPQPVRDRRSGRPRGRRGVAQGSTRRPTLRGLGSGARPSVGRSPDRMAGRRGTSSVSGVGQGRPPCPRASATASVERVGREAPALHAKGWPCRHWCRTSTAVRRASARRGRPTRARSRAGPGEGCRGIGQRGGLAHHARRTQDRPAHGPQHLRPYRAAAAHPRP